MILSNLNINNIIILSDYIILLLHIIIFYFFALSPVIDNCRIKFISLILITFFTLQLSTKYGKCGLINIEKYFLKEKFKNGFVFRLIKPLICYKKNAIYKHYFLIMLIYILVLYIQIKNANCEFNIFNEIHEIYQYYLKKK